MVQLQVLTGSQAGATVPVEKLPFRIGRGAGVSLSLNDAGVWEKHLELEVSSAEGFALRLLPPALATVNGQPFERVVLRNGDLIAAGEVKLRFWLSPTRQSGVHLRETLTWLGIAALCAIQLAVVYWLLS
ncbi:MAG: hypothetical protein HY301_05170 [Verrucomicrobia bacterium]|nr:hypothetical protein [Verrucomicrobiota bacterium]